jgi:predicted dehydrogenase
VKVAVAGLGWWGRQICRSLGGSPKFQILYGVDPNPSEDIGAFAAEFGVKLETDLDVVLKDDAVDGVILATPHALHEEQILAAVAAGKNVFCEKPLTMTGAGATRVLDACRKAGTVLGVGHERRWEPAFEELARVIASGALGKLLHMDANVSHDLLRGMSESNWRLDPVHSPAGMMTAVGIHLTDLFVSFAGPAGEVRAQTARMIFNPPAEDFVVAHVRFKSGVRATMTSLSVTPYYGRFTVFGDAGWVEIVNEANVDKGKPTIFTRGDGKSRQTKIYEAVDTVRLNFEAWADAIDGRAPYRFTSDQLVANIRLFEALVQSTREDGKPITL